MQIVIEGQILRLSEILLEDIMRNSKLIFSVTIAAGVSLGIGAASAADLPARTYTKAPPMMVDPVYNWSGFYAGINGGGGSSRNCWNLTNNAGTAVVPPAPEGCHNATGGTAGGQIGYRWQSAAWVFGVEAQGNWANFQGTNVNIAGGAGAVGDRSRIDAFGLFTGQVGYAINNVLLYVKGGAAVTSDKYNNYAVATNVDFSNGSDKVWGGVVGVGLEYGFASNWSVALEYDHMFMGTQSETLTLNAGGGLSGMHNISQDVDIGTVRLNYRFGGPVVAKY